MYGAVQKSYQAIYALPVGKPSIMNVPQSYFLPGMKRRQCAPMSTTSINQHYNRPRKNLKTNLRYTGVNSTNKLNSAVNRVPPS